MAERIKKASFDYWEQTIKDIEEQSGENALLGAFITRATDDEIREIVRSMGYTLDDDDYIASTKKSKKATKMAKNRAISKFKSSFKYDILKIDELASLIDDAYAYLDRDGYIFDDNESPLYNNVANGIDELIEDMERLHTYLVDAGIDYDEGKYASTKKSKRDDINKRLAKLGGFVKEDDEKKIPIENDDVVEIEDEDGEKVVEIESEETHDKEVENGEESDDDNLNACGKGSRRPYPANKKRMKMKKGEDMPADADDFQNDNQKGSGNAGSTLPEDADENQEINEKGSGSAGSELPEDADDQQDIKESTRKARLERMKSRQKGVRKNEPPVRKFSVTPGGQPNQESYNQRYSQAPMVREAINRHLGNKTDKSFDEVGMMQDRIDNLMKSKRNPSANNGVPKRLR